APDDRWPPLARADARDRPLLGGSSPRRASLADVPGLRPDLFSSAPLLPRLYLPEHRSDTCQWARSPAQLCDLAPARTRFRAALHDCGSETGRGAENDEQHRRHAVRSCLVAARPSGGSYFRVPERPDQLAAVQTCRCSNMTRARAAVIGAAETTEMGKLPHISQLQLHADAALNALADAGLKPSDIDGIATAGETPESLALYLGITPTWIDATGVGGCSFLMHLRHGMAAIEAGLCRHVLITHGESGRSRVAAAGFPHPIAGSLPQQFETPYGTFGPPTMFTIPVLRYLKDRGYGQEDLARVAVVQREWAALNPRASQKAPITIDDVMSSKMIAYPFRMLMCCLVT